MLQFFRDGFLKDYIVLMLVTIVVGAIFSSGLAWAVDSHFGDSINQMIGDQGEYDLILHIREEAKEVALRELERIAEEQFPGAKINETLTVAGQSNIFFGFPPAAKTEEVFVNLPGIFNGVPGLNGYTVIVEPSILIRGVHPSVRQQLQERFQEITGVKFSFKDGLNMLVVLDSMDNSKAVSEEIQAILDEYQILELRFPMGFQVDTGQVANEVMDLIKDQVNPDQMLNVSSAEYGEELDAFLKTLVEMRNFLLSYASKVRIKAKPGFHLVEGEQIVVQGTGEVVPSQDSEFEEGLVVVEVINVQGDQAEGMIIKGSISDATEVLEQKGYRLLSNGTISEYMTDVELENERYYLQYAVEESLRLLRELDELAVEASLAVENADAILNSFQEALMQLEVLQIQLHKLSEGLTQNGTQSASEQLIVSLLVNGLVKNLVQAGAENLPDNSLQSLEDLDVEAMRSSLSNIASQITNVQDIDVQAIIDQISYVRDSLPLLEDEDIGKSIRLINTYLAGQVIPGERVQILIQNGIIDDKQFEAEIRDSLDNDYVNTYLTTVGMINPDARAELFKLLKEIRATIAGMLAVVFVIAILILDQATIFSTLKFLRSTRNAAKNKILRLVNPAIIFSSLIGMILLSNIYLLAKAEIPFVTIEIVAIAGLIIGALIGGLSERFSPVNSQEIMAGQALGLSNVQIMREIVIPASRPGLLNLLNRAKQRF